MFKIKNKDFVINSATNKFPIGLFYDKNDWESFSSEDLPEHLKNIHAFLLDRIKTVGLDNAYLSDDGAKELQFILDAFIQAKLAKQEFDNK